MKNIYLANMKIDQNKVLKYAEYLHDFCHQYIKKNKLNGVVIGLSGGIDSSTSLAILAKKKDIKITGVFIDINSSKQAKKNVNMLAKKYQFKYLSFNLTSIYQNIVKTLKLKNHLAKINLKVRLRTLTLYALASQNKQLVIGNSNYDEIVTGFFTKFGDNACDIALLSRLVKHQVKMIAKAYGVPKVINDQAPSAGLYVGQTDEKELHSTYKAIDQYLLYNSKISKSDYKNISKLIKINHHKNIAPLKPLGLSNLRHLKCKKYKFNNK